MADPITLKSFLPSTRPGRRRIAVAIALGSAAGLTSLAVPWLAGRGLSNLVSGQSGLALTIAAIVGLLAVRLLLEFGSVLTTGTERFRLVESLRQKWHAKILAIPPGGEGKSRRQEWVSILNYDIPRVAEVYVDLPVSLVPAVLTFAGALIAMAILSPLLTLVVGLLAPLAYFAARALARRMRALAIDYWDLEVASMTAAEEAFHARGLIQAFGQETRWQAVFGERTRAAREAGVAHLRLLAFLGPATQFATFAGIVAIVALGRTMLEVSLAPGELLTFVLYGLLLSSPLRAFANGWSTYQEASGTLGRFDAVPEPPVFGDEDQLPADLELSVRELEFGWNRDEAPVLTGSTLRVGHGEHIAIMGANGAGKSTLVSLLLGFARPWSGSIAIGATQLDRLTKSARSRLFTVVRQSVILVNGTIRDNVAFGRPDATDGEIRAALDAALALDFVDGLPDGLDSRVDEDGRNFSGGQRQRIAVARALLMDSPIVLFDEAASSYDPASRHELVARCREALRGRTVIWVTHHEDPLRHVDRVVHLREGRFSGMTPVVHETGS